MGSELAVVESKGIEQVNEENVAAMARREKDIAGACKEIVLRTVQNIQGKKYVRVEGWQSIAVVHGCVASVRDVEVVPGGVRATGELRSMRTGQLISTAFGFVGDDEKTWSARPMFARMAMAQTRSISRVCRSAFAHIVTLMNEGLETTPAEEMEAATSAERQLPPAPLGVEKLRQAATAPAPKTTPNGSPRRLDLDASEPPPHTDSDAPPMEDAQVVEAPKAADASRPPPVTFRYGRGKDKTSRDVSDADLEWYVAGARKSVEDPEKARFREKNAAELELLQAEQRWRQGGGR